MIQIANDLYMITGENPHDEESFLERLNQCLKSGIKLFQLRAKSLKEKQYINLAKKCLSLAKNHDAKLILNCSIDVFNEVDADGLQLTSLRLHSFKSRPIGKNKLLAASCHNNNDLIASRLINVDFVTLSPVQKTSSHPEAEPLGWDNFTKLARSFDKPIYALGGLSKEDLAIAKEHGASGIAAISSLWHKEGS